MHTLPKGLPARFRLFLRLRRSDLVVLQRKLFNATNFLALRFNARRLLFDLDDALFIRDSKSVKLKSLTRTIRFFRTARRSTAVACGNDWVLKRARRFNRKAERIPTVVDTDRYAPPRRHGASETFRAVWIGGRSTLFYLTALIPHLEPLAREIPRVRLAGHLGRVSRFRGDPHRTRPLVPGHRGRRHPGMRRGPHAPHPGRLVAGQVRAQAAPVRRRGPGPWWPPPWA